MDDHGEDVQSQADRFALVTAAHPPATSSALPYCMTAMETACGWVTGGSSGSVPGGAVLSRSPLEGLENAILPALVRAPCVVEFSGGRDSSVVLAVACRVA